MFPLSPAGVRRPRHRVAVAFEGVTKQFSPTVRGLDDVSLTVPSGQRVVLLGASGSGKSTLLRHVNRLQAPTSGTVWVHGEDTARLRSGGVRRMRREVGFVFQDFFLVGSSSALENVCTGMLGTLIGPRMGTWTYPRSVRRRAVDLLDRVGMADRAFQRADTLSGGQQQRVAIARALIQEPSILCADEPVASLDPETSAGVLDLITRISTEDDLTVLMSLHQVEFALGFAERVIGLSHGRVVLDQSAAELDQDTVMAVYRRTGITPDVTKGDDPLEPPHAPRTDLHPPTDISKGDDPLEPPHAPRTDQRLMGGAAS